jgi:hypothetical protein
MGPTVAQAEENVPYTFFPSDRTPAGPVEDRLEAPSRMAFASGGPAAAASRKSG